MLVQSTKRVRIPDDAGILSVGQVCERFVASDSWIATRIADTNLPRPIMFSPGKPAPRFWWFASVTAGKAARTRMHGGAS
jgi:predicted DNA-binding transcriptional regulator AlpA